MLALDEFRDSMNAVYEWVRNPLLRELIRVPVEPNGLVGVGFAHWNGAAVQSDNKHRPLVLVGATEPRYFIVREMANREAIASDGSGGKRNRLPGMPHVVQAVSICPVTVLPGLAPCNAGQNQHDRGKAAGQLQIKMAERALLGHVCRRTVVI